MTEPVRIGDATIYTGDALEVLRTMTDESVHCIVTSPPYWGLRDYGVQGQLGLEKTPEEYVTKMVEVFREARRVLRDDGTAWVNMGDSYAGSGCGWGGGSFSEKAGHAAKIHGTSEHRSKDQTPPAGCKQKDLVGIPWMLAFALRADGWYLRSDIIWHKLNPMPESVTDRPTRAHEYIFLLSKSARYFYDAEAVRESTKNSDTHSRGPRPHPMPKTIETGQGIKNNRSFTAATWGMVTVRNRRSVWTVPTSHYKGAHFATFPPELVKPCILAGCPADGIVLDPFGGSGTTAEVALEYGRRAILIELNPKYVELAKNRLRPVAGRPLLIGG